MTEPVAQPVRKWRPRFSLLTALLVTALVACAVMIWQLWAEIRPLREEVIKRREEMGQLFIVDADKPHAIGVDWNDEGVWRWRLYLPPDRNWLIRTYVGEHSALGYDFGQWLESVRAGNGRIRTSVGGIRSGEHTLEIKVAKDGDQWYLREDKGAKDLIPKSFNRWLDDAESWFPLSKVLYASQTVYERGQPILLLCLQRANESKTDGTDGDTIAVWIEESR